MAKFKTKKRNAIILRPGEGRTYPMGRIRSTFKADGAETANTYSVSEWWMDPNTKGPNAHSHEEDHVYYGLEGVMSVFVDKKWIDLPRGGVVVIPGGVTHTFENRSLKKRAGFLSFNNQSGFEDRMAGISQWFIK